MIMVVVPIPCTDRFLIDDEIVCTKTFEVVMVLSTVFSVTVKDPKMNIIINHQWVGSYCTAVYPGTP